MIGFPFYSASCFDRDQPCLLDTYHHQDLMWWTPIVAIKIGILWLHLLIDFFRARMEEIKRAPTSTLIRFLIESLFGISAGLNEGEKESRPHRLNAAAADSWPPIRKCLVAHQLLQTANGPIPSPFTVPLFPYFSYFTSAQTLLSVCTPWIVVLSPLIPVEGGTEGKLQLISPLFRFRIEDVALLVSGEVSTSIEWTDYRVSYWERVIVLFLNAENR